MTKKERTTFQKRVAKYANSVEGRDMYIRLSLAQYAAIAVAATSHDEVAKAFGIRRNRLSDILVGRVNLSVKEIADMAFELGVRFKIQVVA